MRRSAAAGGASGQDRTRPGRPPALPRILRAYDASMRPISSTQPALASGSLRLPHFGDCTQDGQPRLARALADEPVGVVDERLERVEAAAGDADPAGVAVVDEDRRAAGLRVQVRRQPADVPAVAHRQQRQHGDLRVLGGVQRAEQLVERYVGASTRSSSSYQSAWVANDVCGQVERDEVDRLVVGEPLALVGEHLLGDDDGAEREPHAERLAAVEQRARCSVSVSRLGCVYQSPRERLHERAAVRRGRARATSNGGRRAGRSRPAWTVEGARAGVDGAEHLARAARRRSPRRRGSRERSDTAAGRVLVRVARGTKVPSGRRRRSPAPTSVVGDVRASPARASRRRRARAAPRARRRAGARRRAARSRGSRIAASTGRSRNSSGWRQKNWSSASSPAT